jgi:hypothetical protein
MCCQDNCLSPNVCKTKKLIVDYRKQRAEHSPIHIDEAVVEQVERLKLISVHITKELSRSTHTNTVFPLWSLKRFGMAPQILKKLESCTIESLLTGCITSAVWFSNKLKNTQSHIPNGNTFFGRICFVLFYNNNLT